MRNYRSVLQQSRVIDIIGKLEQLQELQDQYKDDSYLSKQFSEIEQAIEDMEQAIELIIDIEYNLY